MISLLNFHMPVRMVCGENCLAQHGNLLACLGKRCFLVTGKSSAKLSGAWDDAVSVLSRFGIAWEYFDRIGPNPKLQDCRAAGLRANDFHADFILGIGGGSVLDAAKATAVFAANPELDEVAFYSTVWAAHPLPIALIGTTSGTGSEVTNVAVLTDSRLRKHSLHVDSMYAAVSFGDPRYTLSLPQKVTISTGIDVVAHATESYFSKKADAISRACSVKSMRMALPVLETSLRGDAPTLDQREQIYEASILGGLAISTTGTVFPHNVGYYLTEKFGIPHGIACAVFQTDLLSIIMERIPGLADAFYTETGTNFSAIKRLTDCCTTSMSVSMKKDEIERILPRWENNNSVKNTLGNVTSQDIERILIRRFCKS